MAVIRSILPTPAYQLRVFVSADPAFGDAYDGLITYTVEDGVATFHGMRNDDLSVFMQPRIREEIKAVLREDGARFMEWHRCRRGRWRKKRYSTARDGAVSQ